MHIAKITIKRFKSFERVDFEFDKKVNLFTGTNNSGKTTALEGLALWFECYERLVRKAGKGYKGRYSKEDFMPGTTYPYYVSYMDVNSIRSPNFEDIFHNLNAETGNSVSLSTTLKSEDGRELELEFVIAKADGDNYKINCGNYNVFDFKLFNDPTFIKDPENLFQLSFASPISTVLPKEERQLGSKIRYLKKTGLSDQVFRNRLDLLKSRRNDDFERFRGDLKSILTDNRDEIEFDFSFDAQELYTIVKIKVGRESFKDVFLMGSGTLQIIEVLLSLYEDRRQLNVFLLDEPDSHIHHSLQRRLLEAIEKFADNCQVFMTTHNEALLRSAKHEWVFHLEAYKSTASYKPIVRNNFFGIKKGMQPSRLSPIIKDLTGATSLDFIQALEADKLVLVEGEDDALHLQLLFDRKINARSRLAYWALDGVDAVFGRLGAMKEMFNNVRNTKSLWDKSVLIIDKDCMTDQQRTNLIIAFKSQLKIETHVWASYNFESVVLSEPGKLVELLHRLIISKGVTAIPNLQVVSDRLAIAIQNAIGSLKTLYSEEELNRVFSTYSARRNRLSTDNNVKGIFEPDRDLKQSFQTYIGQCLTPESIHKICRKPQLEAIIAEVMQPEGLSFSLEADFSDLLSQMNGPSTWIAGYDYVLTL